MTEVFVLWNGNINKQDNIYTNNEKTKQNLLHLFQINRVKSEYSYEKKVNCEST